MSNEKDYWRVIQSGQNVTPLDLVAAHVGNQSRIAERLKITRAAISEWRYGGRIPQQYVMPLHTMTGIPLQVLLQTWKPHKREHGRKRRAA